MSVLLLDQRQLKKIHTFADVEQSTSNLTQQMHLRKTRKNCSIAFASNFVALHVYSRHLTGLLSADTVYM